jgi:hypothetical protein
MGDKMDQDIWLLEKGMKWGRVEDVLEEGQGPYRAHESLMMT